MNVMPSFEETKAEMADVLEALGIDDLAGFRAVADELLAEHVAAGWPRALAGAMAMIGLTSVLSKKPQVIAMRLSEAMETISTGRMPDHPIEQKLALAILINSFSPETDASDLPEWDDGTGR